MAQFDQFDLIADAVLVGFERGQVGDDEAQSPLLDLIADGAITERFEDVAQVLVRLDWLLSLLVSV